ncbi:hypothetical protein [Nitrosomonas sp. Is79A3]|uniref:hypothetical protein n=1 Tax=Nitrosomonas sp. (strain Is79A3) TaxID=261292 RepID=UPI00030B60DD
MKRDIYFSTYGNTLHGKFFVKPGYITNGSRKSILNFALAMQYLIRMQGLWDAKETFDLPIRFALMHLPEDIKCKIQGRI